MSGRRHQRVCELLRAELSRLMSREKTLEGTLLTIVDVTLSPDFKQATAYFSSLNPRLRVAETEALLDDLAHHWHRDIAKRVHMKYIPRFIFRFDQSLERGDRVLNILRELDTPPGNTD
ncbi:MAG: ribosome-binding factor A [Candidatus Methylacidiphilales bacterium]